MGKPGRPFCGMGLEPWDLCKQAGCFVRVRVQAAHSGPERVAPCTPTPHPVSSWEASHLFTLRTPPPLLWSSAAILLPLSLPGGWELGPRRRTSEGWPHCLPGSRQPRQSPAQGPLSQNSKVGRENQAQQAKGPVLLSSLGKWEGSAHFTVSLVQGSRLSQCYLLGTFTCPESVESLPSG